jgi:hypothetical protein
MDAEVVEVNGNIVGLRAYMTDLADHLEAEAGRRDQTVAAMTAIGVPPVVPSAAQRLSERLRPLLRY